ncbi:hypothetical protein BKM09_000440 [Pseudomonas amygdali pv. morsprunorum]|nr:hypothetical protein BKM09_000440 [Pseudomonas amygdali pv. morsprunorum]
MILANCNARASDAAPIAVVEADSTKSFIAAKLSIGCATSCAALSSEVNPESASPSLRPINIPLPEMKSCLADMPDHLKMTLICSAKLEAAANSLFA